MFLTVESHVAKQLLPSTSIWCGNHCHHSQDDPKLPQIHPPGILKSLEFETIKIQSNIPHSSNLSIANFLVLWSSKSSVGCANMGNATTQLWSYWWGITSKIRISPGDHGALVSLFIRYSCAQWLVGVWHVGVNRFLSPGPLAYRNGFEWLWQGIFTGFNNCHRWRSFQSISIS